MKNVNKSLIFMLLAALLFGAVLTACGGEDPTPTPRATDDDDDDDPPPDEDEEEPTEEPEPTAEPTADPTAGFIDFSNDVLGISMSYPEDWAIEFDEAGEELRLATSQDILDDADDNIEGAILNMLFLDRELLSVIGGEDVDTNDPVAVLNIFAELFTSEETSGDITMTVSEEPTAVTINGQESAQVTAEATDAEGDTAVMKILVIMSDDRAVIILAGSEVSVEEENRPILDAIENSIALSTPVGTPVTEDPIIPDSAGFLLYGDSVAGAVDESGPSVWDFVGLEGEVVDIIVAPEGDFDVVVDVLDENGASILPNGEVDDAFGTEEILELSIPTSGNFTITVRGFADASGNYQLTIVESGTEISTSPPVISGEGEPIAYGDLVSGAVDSDNPVVSYSFSGAADDVVGMIITPAGEFDAVVDVVDAAGNSLLPRERDASFGQENVLVSLPAEGVYTVNVYGFEGSTGTFDMQMGFPLTNLVIAAGDTLEAEDEGEGHAFPFTVLRAGDMIGIYVEPSEDLDLAIQVRQGDELLSGLGFETERGFDASIDVEEFVMIAEESGTYSFRILNSVDDFAGNTGEYEVVLFGSPEVIFELAYGDFVDARTNEEGLVDYVISGLAGESLVVNVASDDDTVDMIIEILDLDENVLASIDDGFSGEVEELVYTFENEELVIIRVRDFYGGEGDFAMSVDLQ